MIDSERIQQAEDIVQATCEFLSEIETNLAIVTSVLYAKGLMTGEEREKLYASMFPVVLEDMRAQLRAPILKLLETVDKAMGVPA